MPFPFQQLLFRRWWSLTKPHPSCGRSLFYNARCIKKKKKKKEQEVKKYYFRIKLGRCFCTHLGRMPLSCGWPEHLRDASQRTRALASTAIEVDRAHSRGPEPFLMLVFSRDCQKHRIRLLQVLYHLRSCIPDVIHEYFFKRASMNSFSMLMCVAAYLFHLHLSSFVYREAVYIWLFLNNLFCMHVDASI